MDEDEEFIKKQKISGGKNIFENRAYISTFVLLGLFYFFDVFIGMFMLYREYEQDGPIKYLYNENHYSLTDRPYDIIELILLAILLTEIIAKAIFTTKS